MLHRNSELNATLSRFLFLLSSKSSTEQQVQFGVPGEFDPYIPNRCDELSWQSSVPKNKQNMSILHTNSKTICASFHYLIAKENIEKIAAVSKGNYSTFK